MLKLREGIESAKIAASVSASQSGRPGSSSEPSSAAEEKDKSADEPFNIREEIELLIEIQDILDELDILKMVRKEIPLVTGLPRENRPFPVQSKGVCDY